MSKKKAKVKSKPKAKAAKGKKASAKKTKFKFAKPAPEMEAAAEEDVTPEEEAAADEEVAADESEELSASAGDESADGEIEGELDLEFAEDEDADEAGESEEDILMEASDDEVSEDEVSDDEAAGEELEASGEEIDSEEPSGDPAIENSELGAFESAEIEDVDQVPAEQIRSVVESVLFTTDKPISIALIKQAFKGTNVKSKDIRDALTSLSEEYLNSSRGFTLDEIAGGFQLRTKPENMKFLRQSVKARPFKLSGPALEVLSIVAYKQPVTKAQIDEIRGVESGHLLRALMEKHLLTFGERSDLPGKPMFYETARKFLEIFGLRNLQELPSLNEIDQLIPEGIGEVEKKETLSDLTGELSAATTETYSVGEEELLKITDELSQITTSSEFFEKEKERMREKRDSERAQSIREAMLVGETVEDKDRRWLERFEAAKIAAEQSSTEVAFVTEGILEGEAVPETSGGEALVADTVATDDGGAEISEDSGDAVEATSEDSGDAVEATSKDSDDAVEATSEDSDDAVEASTDDESSDEGFLSDEMAAEEADAVSGDDALFESDREPEQEI